MRNRQRSLGWGVPLLLVPAIIGCAPFAVTSGNTNGPQISGIAQEVQSLLQKMTLREKIGQMTLVDTSVMWANQGQDSSQLDAGAMGHFLGTDDVGAVLNGGSDNPSPNTPAVWAAQSNTLQQFAISHSRLHIPLLYGIDAVHGDGHIPGAAVFPQNLGMAATWDPSLVEAEGVVTAKDLMATGVRWDFSPDADIMRDVRWGRDYETFGEDPFLASQMVSAAVTGLQGRSAQGLQVAATAKHFLGYSEPLTGHDRMQEELPLRYLRETFYPSSESAIGAGVSSVMAQSGSLNDVPATSSRELLTGVLRYQMKFRGFVVSDWGDVDALYCKYHVASSEEDAIREAINAGVDMTMLPYDADTFEQDLTHLVQTHQVSMARINEAVSRILTTKFALGLFNHPYVDAGQANQTVYHQGQTLVRTAADESLVLLKNTNHVLPLSKSLTSILVTGLSADSIPNQMGGWTIGWQGMPSGSTEPGAVSVLQGIRAAVGANHVVYDPGVNLSHVQQAAVHAKAAIVVVGETPYAEGFGDTETDALSTAQQQLIRTVEATGVPTVVVVLAGRPLIMTDAITHTDALLAGFLPGSQTGTAVADVVFGAVDPSGRLPASWPRYLGDEPLFYTLLPGTNSGPLSGYQPLFPFGYGLSYTDFSLSALRVSAAVSPTGTIRATLTVQNTGRVKGTDVLQAMISQATSRGVIVPPARLVAFARVSLQAGQSRTVTLTIPASRLAIIPGDIDGAAPLTVEPGTYTLSIGGLSQSVQIK